MRSPYYYWIVVPRAHFVPPVLVSSSKDLSDTTTWLPTVVLTSTVGQPFTGATDVKFGAVSSPSFSIDTPTQITAQVPAHAAGSAPITVKGPGGISNALPFEYWDPNVPGVPTSFMEKGDYTIDGLGVGRWTARTGFGAIQTAPANVPQNNPVGTAKMVATDGDHLLSNGHDWETLIGRSAAAGCTIAIVVDLLSFAGPNGALTCDHEFWGALNIDRDGTGVPTVPAPQIWFAYNTIVAPAPQGYKFVAVHIAGPGRIVLVFVRDVSGPNPVIRMTKDGVVYTPDVIVGNLTAQSFDGIYIGDFPLGPYPTNTRWLTMVTAKTAWSAANITKFYKWAALIP